MWVRPVADYFVRRGYAVVLQDLRGRQKSEGTGRYFQTCNPTEGPDGYDTVEWVAWRVHFRPTPFYLHPGGELRSEAPAAAAASATFTYDPATPVPTIGGTCTSFWEMLPIQEGVNEAY